MKISKIVLGVFVLLLVAGAVFALRARRKSVTVVLPTTKLVTESIAASGRLRGAIESDIGAQNSGRVATILVREGETVRRGQKIARLDDRVLQAQLIQARIAVRTARGKLAQAEATTKTARAQWEQVARPPLAADVTRLRADVRQANAVNAAKAVASRQKAISAYQRYQELTNGTRSEELEQAEAEVRQVEASLLQHDRDRKRQQALYESGAVARTAAEQAETTYLVGKQSLENLQAKVRQLRSGNRAEQVAQAEADWRAADADADAAEAAVQGARESGEAQVASLLASPRPEDVAVARRRYEEAQRSRDVVRDQLTESEAALTLARRRLSETALLAPFAGTVTQIVTEVGAVTGASTPVVRLVRTGIPEIHVDLDESNLGKLRIGQEAVVTNDAFPDSRFSATVTAIGAQVDTDRGTVEVRLTPRTPPSWVRPGQTFSVNIITGRDERRLVVPATAVTTIGGVSSLLVIENGKVVNKPVKTAPLGEGGVPVLEGVTERTPVIVDPAGVAVGEAVVPRRADGGGG
jgi:RND family efflux transporter MFP subunit